MRRIGAISLADSVTKSGSQFRTNVSIELYDGSYLRRDPDLPKGEFRNFLTSRELRAKFRSIVSPCVSAAGEALLHKTIMKFKNESVHDLFQRTMPATNIALAGED